MTIPTQPLTQIEFSETDHARAAELARRLGYEQTAYTSTSGLWGLYCLRENPEHARRRGLPLANGCIIRTRELGLMFVQTLEDFPAAQDLHDAEIAELACEGCREGWRRGRLAPRRFVHWHPENGAELPCTRRRAART